MATQVKYKFGDDEFDLKDYIHNLETNYQSYIASKNWNEGQQQEFKNAFDRYLTGLKDQLSNNTGRFYTDYSGAIFDNKGELSNTDDDNIDPVGSEYYYNNKGQRITTDDYNLLRKRKQKNFNTFSANRQVATYLNKVGTALREYSKRNPSSNSSNTFNLSKHGFEKYWMDQNNPSGGDFDFAPYVEKDQVGENGVRGTSNRASYLKEQLENYVDSLGDYDFSSTVYKDKDTYLSKLRAAIENLNNGYNHEDTIALNQAGLSRNFLRDFFSTGEQKQKSEVEEAADYIAAEQKRQQDQQVLDQAAKMKAMSELDQWAKDNQFQSRYSGVLEGGDYGLQDILDTIDKDYSDIEGGDNRVRAWLNFEQLLKDIKEPVIEPDAFINGRPVSIEEGSKAAMKKLRNDIAKKLKIASKYGFMKSYGDEYVIPGSEDYNNYTLMTYNPITGEYKDQSILLNEKLREAMAYDWYKKNKSVSINENGGVLQYLQEGGYARMKKDADLVRKQQKQQKQEQENKPKDDTRTPEQRKAGERVPKKGELSTIDKIRIGSAVTDIGSILAAFVPGYGTAASAVMGLGSTGSNLYADISDDSVSGWQAAGNAGFGLLMDLVGLIPGLGATGKAGKIAKTLKYVLPTALTIWGVSENGGDAIKAANKLMNGQDLTVDDWKALSFGLQTIAGGTRAVKGNKSVNKQLKNAKEVVPYRTITAESGKTYKVNPEQFKQITSATTLDAQNKAFREAIGNSSESLGNKFKTSKWERVRHPFTSEPKTGKGVDYIDRNINLSTMERIPYQFKVHNGQLTPRRGSNEWILQKTGRWTFGDPSVNWFTRKNPLYNKPAVLQDPTSITSVPQTKSSIRPGSGPNIRQLRMWNRTPGYARTQGYGRDFGIGNTRNKREIDLGIEFDKHGGVLKCQDGNILTPTGRAGVRKKDTYTFNTTNRLQSVLNKIKEGKITVDDANEFQRRHYSMYSQWNQQPIQGQAVSQYQTDYNNQGWNNEIIAPEFTNNYNIQSPNPNSGDSISGNWTIDGIYDQITDDRRVMARDSDYKDQVSRDSDIKLAEQFGFEYYLDPETRYWMLRDGLNKDEGQISQIQQQGSPTKNEPVQEKQDLEDSKTNYNPLQTILNNPTIVYGLPRAMYADRMNRRMTDLAKQSITPLLKDPFQVHRYTRSDLDAEMQGERNYANLRRLASRPITSDGSLQTATQLQAEVQGQEARTAGKEKSNQVQRQYDELAWQQEKENSANRHETAMFNRAQLWNVLKTKAAFDQAYLSKKHNIWDVFGQQLEFDARTKLNETKALRDRFAQSDIHSAVSNSPNEYEANLTSEELTVWNKVLTGTNPSSLGDELNTYIRAMKKVSDAEQQQLGSYYNIPRTIWSRRLSPANSDLWKPDMSKAKVNLKDGGKQLSQAFKLRQQMPKDFKNK